MKTFRYEGEYLREISMPVGGIGAGCVGLGGNGALVDWEIDGPGKGRINPFTHFAVKAQTKEGVTALVLQGDHQRELTGQYCMATFRHEGFGYGPDSGTMAGFPHFSRCSFEGAFPWAKVSFGDDRFPGKPSLSAFSSFIPRNTEDSSLPCAFYTVEIENDTEEEVTYIVSMTLGTLFESSMNRAIREDGRTGLTIEEGDNSLCVLTDADDTSVQTCWFRGGWFDIPTVYWNQVERPGFLPDRTYGTAGHDCGVTEVRKTVSPGERWQARFVLAWRFPVQVNRWDGDRDDRSWTHWYAARFASAKEAATYALRQYSRLERETLAFRDALYSSSLPEKALEAAGASLSILVTPVCLRLPDGSFWAWEGESERGGSCEGTCQHVWNYAYALPYLFPDLEKSVRRLEKEYSQWDDGRISFRLRLPAGRGKGWKMPCLDGQMGYILKIYREWKFSGDEEWLREMFPSAKRALEFAWLDTDVKWDADRDGVLEGRQHHTLDMELFGPSSWLQGFYVAALKAMAEMARHLGQDDGEYLRLFENGRRFLNEELFNGRYYFQKVNLTDRGQLMRFQSDDLPGAADYWNDETGEIKYQIGEGLIIDQALAQWHANLMGLGSVFDRDKLHTALESLYRLNFKEEMRLFFNPCRVFSLNDEAGTVMCEYPADAKKPVIPVPYCQETMTGFEYAAAALMVQEGLTKEAERMIEAVRDRYDGKKRNPYNEIECGNNYSRTMAAFSFIPSYAGYSFDGVKEEMGFAPADETCQTLWFTGSGWGSASLTGNSATLTVLGGTLRLRSLKLPFAAEQAESDGSAVPFASDGNALTFHEPLLAKKEIRIAGR